MVPRKSKRGDGRPGRSWGGAPRKAPAPRDADGGTLTLCVAARPALFREVLARQLGDEPGFRVLGTARDEDQILRLLTEKPRVLLFDYEGLGPNGKNLISRLRRAGSGTRILVFATRSNDETVEQVLRVGAAGLVGKQLEFATLVRAIRAVAAGEIWANRRAVAQAFEHIVDPANNHNVGLSTLTKREQEITHSVGRGLRNKEIARGLNISEKTVKSHLNNIFRKLQVDNRFAVGLYSLDIKLDLTPEIKPRT
jgi:DNA-binding NarL/FixJ family response regulator